MSFYAYLKFFHLLFVALFIGAFTAMALLWTRGRLAADSTIRQAYLDAVVFLSQRLATVAGSILLLAGILMLVDQPAMLKSGPLFHIKMTLGVLVVGASHVAHAKAKRLRAAMSEERVDARSERLMDLATWFVPALAFVVLFLGVFVAHG
jgi:uncharacterized membrane protein